MACEVGEARQLQEVLPRGRLIDDLVLKNPGEVVGNEDGVQSGRESWVYVGARAVADHPGIACFATVMRGD